jgi:sugar lactone lactonase YvrE
MTWSFGRTARILASLAFCGAAAAASAQTLPPTIPLPLGWQPEGIASGRGPTLYVGSLASGAIYALDARTGDGRVLSPGVSGQVAAGLKFDSRSNLIYVAGGPSGAARAIDAATGAVVATYALGSGFINDVVVTPSAGYFTNSTQPLVYRLPLGPGGQPASPTAVEQIPLSGDWQQVAGFNANGIEAAPQGHLLVVNSTLGVLYRIDPATGVAKAVDLGGASLTSGDGLLLVGQTLYVVRNRLNQVAVVELDPGFGSGTVVDTLTSSAFDVPTTLARFAGALYAVNARFGTPATPSTPYDVVRLR